MDRPSFLTKSITIRGVDGNDIRVSETSERKEVVVSIHMNGGESSFRVATVRLNADQFKALCQSQYDLDIEAKPATEKEKEAM